MRTWTSLLTLTDLEEEVTDTVGDGTRVGRAADSNESRTRRA